MEDQPYLWIKNKNEKLNFNELNNRRFEYFN